ncbi:glutathione S-transferase [Dichomitus squalens LYAD-421 SS1]|uniref:glutathione transferase n=1 Tax=Dichomitus squalens (strain LYAD-421) TaxID=732165 RepID=R7SXW4_DICSQ|nr:glutathione S-transferase [Dichomitus squalens LYAD-421 SS1]EJF60570.1 glutathione S-transferase [Dichomitus squalens LYAD-421 SS1]
MVLKIHGTPYASCTKRVLTVVEELKIPHELVLVDVENRAHKSPEHLAHQPFGQIPYIEDDGFEIFESRAISRYLALKYGGIGKLIPAQSDVEATAKFEQAASVEAFDFDPLATKIVWEAVFHPGLGLPSDTAAVKAQTALLEGKMDGYEALLSKTKFLAGDEVSLVDLFHLSYGSYLRDAGLDFLESPRWPSVARWWKEISSRPSWVKVNVPLVF